MSVKTRRLIGAIISIILLVSAVLSAVPTEPLQLPGQPVTAIGPASDVLETLAVKGRAPKTGYDREQFGNGWAVVNGCDTRNILLYRDMSNITLEDGCIVEKGILADPYTGATIQFTRGQTDVQIDHVVALSDAWQKGAQTMSRDQRIQFANDPLNLLAVDGPANQEKSDGDAATWLPENVGFRCTYVARQIAVKQKYALWVTEPEREAMLRVLSSCPRQPLPLQ